MPHTTKIMQEPSVKSPFIIIENSMSPLRCEEIISAADFLMPDIDKFNKPIETTKIINEGTIDFKEIIVKNKETIEQTYGSGILHIDPTRIIFTDSTVVPRPQCDNSTRIKSKWLRVHNRDLTALTFLCDYNDKPPFDSDFEVFGGKIEFPSYGFGFNPIRGTTIIFPSDPHFSHVFSPVQLGEMYITKTFITLQSPLLYSSNNFPGTWKEWLHTNF